MDIPSFGDNAALFSVLVGFFLPMVVAVINQPHWSDQVRGLMAMVSSIVAGAGTAYFSGHWDSTDILRSIMIVLIISQVAYTTFFKGSEITKSIENKTSSTR